MHLDYFLVPFGPSTEALALDTSTCHKLFSGQSTISSSSFQEHKEGLGKSRFAWDLRKQYPSEITSEKHQEMRKITQHSVFISSNLILVICPLWFERPANLEPFFPVMRGPILWLQPEPPLQPLEAGVGFLGTQGFYSERAQCSFQH